MQAKIPEVVVFEYQYVFRLYMPELLLPLLVYPIS